ncbi:hypothetical protein CARUB_v10006229mg [Capsella rubella]|uniref:Uncharacterized protein n=1 Tax=Capsella rubella TaxID=81985 RepID=R0H2U0_9BRAS|nr:hypothetical protein CARUB_v10006229mg [Capsella rubella]
MAEEEEMRRHLVLTKPFSLEDEKDSEHTTSNVIRKILSLIKTVRPGSDLANFQIKCPEIDLEAELNLISDSFIERFRGNNNRSIKGKICQSSSGDQLYDIFGHWDRTVMAKNLKTGKLDVIYNAEENIKGLKPPIVKNLKEVMEKWESTREAKRAVEEKQREASGELWVPKHFSVVKKGKDWDCSPLQLTVPRAPLVITEAQEGIINRFQEFKTLC